MVQGSTNAVIQQGGTSGGAGDIVYAVNQTGKELVAGDKVWLNMTTSENVHSQNYTIDNATYTVANKVFSNGKYRFDWDGEKFEKITIGTLGLANVNGSTGAIQYRDGIRFSSAETFGENNSVIRDDGTPLYLIKPSNVSYIRKILNRTYCIVEHDSQWFVRRYEHTTGKVEDTDFIKLKNSSWYRYCYYCLDNSKQAAYIDTSVSPKKLVIIEDIEKGSDSPIVNEYQVAESNFYPLFFTDGFNIGSYCLASTQSDTFKSIQPLIYKFYEDGFKAATDLPVSLNRLINTKTYFDYNNETGVLTLSCTDKTEVHVYKLGEDKLFHEVEFDITLPIDKRNDTNSRFTRVILSDDMSIMAFSYTTTKYYGGLQVYKFNYIDGKWRATTSVECNENTLTGFATGNVNEVGESEISTVLPDKVTLTFNVTPDPDTLELKGIVA